PRRGDQRRHQRVLGAVVEPEESPGIGKRHRLLRGPREKVGSHLVMSCWKAERLAGGVRRRPDRAQIQVPRRTGEGNAPGLTRRSARLKIGVTAPPSSALRAPSPIKGEGDE